MRPLLAVVLLAPTVLGQPFDVPKAVPPDAETLKRIDAKRAELQSAVDGFPVDAFDDIRSDIEIYAKAAEWVVRHGEWFTKDSGKQTLAVLDAGLVRAKAAAGGKTPWRDVRNRPVIRGYRSKVDGSVQPYSVTIPAAFDDDTTPWRLDVVLHGRGATLSEVSFIAGKENAKPAAGGAEFIALEPYGRGNNAYRWAGEADVGEVYNALIATFGERRIDGNRRVLRGFSMGGAGVWHYGLHRPGFFAVLGPGAGFTTTVGKVKFDGPPPDYVQKCLHIYDAVDYAENVFNTPVVAYSGANDPQKAAADNIEAALKGFKEPYKYTHLVAPGLEHKMPPEWQAKAEAEFQKYVGPGRPRVPERSRFVTYTPRYGGGFLAQVLALDATYERALIDARRTATRPEVHTEVRTENVRAFGVPNVGRVGGSQRLTVDAQSIEVPNDSVVEKVGGRWVVVARNDWTERLRSAPAKTARRQGPIDDAFMSEFAVVGPTRTSWSDATAKHVAGSLARFGAEWDKYLRGSLPTAERANANLVLFGDPASNPKIAEIAAKLPITWSKEKLVVNGVEYDPKTHVPVMIYPNPLNPDRYVVLNSGHTFHAKDFQGTNALLYPRLGDWAVLKPTPTAADPAAAEVVAAGLFDEFWQFPKK